MLHQAEIERRRHDHAFGAEEMHVGERRTRWVIALAAAMMVVEIVAGLAFGSMALLADGWHMATHIAALGITAFAYGYARRHARDRRYSFGTGKVSALGGFGSAVTLAVVAVLVAEESITRLVTPLPIHFAEAISVAALGLVVNLVSAFLLREAEHEALHAHHPDHNLRSAYVHVLADALTSVLAIAALLTAMLFGWIWMDAATGILGALVILRWSFGLLRDTAAVLLDAEVSDARRREIQAAVEADRDNRVVDLHLWRVGRRHLAAIVSLVTHEPRAPAHYKELLRRFDDLAHVTVEVHRCTDAGEKCEP